MHKKLTYVHTIMHNCHTQHTTERFC